MARRRRAVAYIARVVAAASTPHEAFGERVGGRGRGVGAPTIAPIAKASTASASSGPRASQCAGLRLSVTELVEHDR